MTPENNGLKQPLLSRLPRLGVRVQVHSVLCFRGSHRAAKCQPELVSSDRMQEKDLHPSSLGWVLAGFSSELTVRRRLPEVLTMRVSS